MFTRPTIVGIDKPQQDDVTGAGRKGLTRGPAGMGCAGRLDEEQALVGIVTSTDLIRYLYDQY